MPDLHVSAAYQPTGDQPQAIAELAEAVARGERYQTLLGVTGTGKTFTMARVIEQLQKPTLVIAHNKTLAAQLCNEFREFFPRQRRRVLRQLLRLLPARGVPPVVRHVHREGLVDQRRHRPPAPRGDGRAVHAARRRHRRVGVVHLRHRLARRATTSSGAARAVGEESPPRGDPARSWSTSSTSATTSCWAAAVPRPRRRDRGPAGRTPSRRYRISLFGDEVESITHFDPLTGEVLRAARPSRGLPGDALRHIERRPLEAAVEAIGAELEERAAPSSRPRASCSRPTACASAPSTTWRCCARWASATGIENYSRILDGRPAGDAAAHAARLLPRRLPDRHRRVAPDGAADRRHVRGRPVAQADARRVRVPAAVGARQPAAAVRRVPRARAAR